MVKGVTVWFLAAACRGLGARIARGRGRGVVGLVLGRLSGSWGQMGLLDLAPHHSQARSNLLLSHVSKTGVLERLNPEFAGGRRFTQQMQQ